MRLVVHKAQFLCNLDMLLSSKDSGYYYVISHRCRIVEALWYVADGREQTC